MPDKNLIFANIAATPTKNSWSQAYNAGKLFAVLSLEKKYDEEIEEELSPLGALGKDILTTLEQEFFSLETKDLETIKSAILITSKKIPEEVNYSFVVVTVVSNILYFFVLGGGRINIKRENEFGTILSSDLGDYQKAGSGYLKDSDLIVIQTKQFAEVINSEKLSSVLDHQSPAEISETIAPMVHTGEESGAAAVIIRYSKEEEENQENPLADKLKEETSPASGNEEVIEDSKYEEEKKTSMNVFAYISPLILSIKKPFQSFKISKSRRGFLAIVIILIAIFVIGIFLSLKKQQDSKTEALFNDVYPQAQKKYDEGQSLMDLNQNLARDNFKAAEKIINDASDQFPKDSKQLVQIADLGKKIQTALSQTSGINSVEAKEAESDASSLLTFENKHSGLGFTTDGKNNFYVTAKSVFKEDKEIIKNDSDWTDSAGLGIYFGNIYVLNKAKGGIIKFIPADSGYAKSNYFTGDTAPDLTKAKSISIDGSIWILESDGTILKFTKGKADTFNVSGLDKPFSSPTKIFTNVDFNNIYVLDNGNSRIVVLDKNGGYKEQYQANVVKNARDLEVNESAKKIYILSSGKIYEIDLK
jgi:hypothetical protein